MLGSHILFRKAVRILMFQLSGFYCMSYGKMIIRFGLQVYWYSGTLYKKCYESFMLLD